jgi:hypothetical protein
MNRYALIGVYENGKVVVIKKGRRDGPDTFIREEIEYSRSYHHSPYKTILLISIGNAEDRSGSGLLMDFQEVDIHPPPTYTLRPAEKLH